MAKASSRSHPLILGSALFFGIAALIAAFIGLVKSAGYGPGVDVTREGLDNFSRLLFDTAGVLGLEQPSPGPSNEWFAAARILAVLFTGLAAIGIVAELYRPFSDFLLRVIFWIKRYVLGKRPATVIGLGWIGGQLAKELRQEGRPVFGVALDEESPRAVEARRRRTLVVLGDAADATVRKRAGLVHAFEVFIATGDDARNIDIAGDLLRDAQTRKGIVRMLFGMNKWARKKAALKQAAQKRWFQAFHQIAHQFFCQIAWFSIYLLRVAHRIRKTPKSCLGRRGKRNKIRCHVHVGDPHLSNTLHDHYLLQERSEAIEFRFFSNQELAASDLFFGSARVREPDQPPPDWDRALLNAPFSDDVFHLFVFGFGSIGQTVALHLARFGHFVSRLRPRLTVFSQSADEEEAWRRFLDRHPAFAPPDLDLSCSDFLAAGDTWHACPGRPRPPAYRTRDGDEPRMEAGCTLHAWPSPLLAPECQTIQRFNDLADTLIKVLKRREVAVEYAVNAELHLLPAEVEAYQLVDAIEARLHPRCGPNVRAAAVVCFDEERRSFHSALRLQRALARRFLNDPPPEGEADEQPPPDQAHAEELRLPISVYLPVETGLAEVVTERQIQRLPEKVRKERKKIRQHFPLQVFGQQREVTSYEAITQSRLRQRARGIRQLYQLISGSRDVHAHFEASDADAARFDIVKLSALGIRFFKGKLSKEEAEQEGVAPSPLLESLCSPIENGSWFRRLQSNTTELGRRLWRWILREKPRDEPEEEELTREEAEKAIRVFKNELKEKVGPDLAAEMEHNRWMGERLSKGWRFGPRSNLRQQRTTMVPWDKLTDDEKHYDRKDLPQLIVERRKSGYYAYVQDPRR